MTRAYTLQQNGQITLPSEWLDKYGLNKGDVITFEETEDGLTRHSLETDGNETARRDWWSAKG
jgi:bifunctional DNA-binding transcriptional regulator/antitoxin component of YhaV-PrlF toxin-antitoxin module